MNIARNSHDGGWSGEVPFRGAKIEFTIDAELWNLDPADIATNALQTLEKRWPDILSSLTGEPLSLYNDQWIDSGSRMHPLSKEEFLSQLSLRSFSVGEGAVFASFSSGDLFAGHVLSVALIGDADPQVALEG
jgi:hypothetical protein